jgi:hypothetical protein
MKKICKKQIDIILSSCINIVHIVKPIKWTLGQVFFCQILVNPTMPRPFSLDSENPKYTMLAYLDNF